MSLRYSNWVKDLLKLKGAIENKVIFLKRKETEKLPRSLEVAPRIGFPDFFFFCLISFKQSQTF